MAAEPRSPALDRLAQLGVGDVPDPGPDGAVPGSAGAQLAASIVVPGVPTMRRSAVVGVVLFAAGVIAPLAGLVWVFLRRDDLVGFVLQERTLRLFVGLSIAVVLVRVFAVIEVAYAFRRRRWIAPQTALVLAVIVVFALPVLWVASRADQARSLVADVFVKADGEPLFTPSADVPIGRGDVTNILLLGGDAGPGRWGLRTDTMILVSIDPTGGRTALISIPRNLTRLQFPPGSPMASLFPNGFDDLTNAVFPYVSTHPDLVEHYGAGGLQPEAVALAEGIGYSLDVVVDDYALVNMQGFLEVVDAIGGVAVTLDQAVPLPPSIPGGKHPVPAVIGPGVVEMDGTVAIAFVRSRSADSDYQRMGRQRQLLAALSSQVTPGQALSSFGAITGLIGDSVRTSLSAGEFSNLVDRLGDSAAVGESVGLSPPLVEPGRPDYDHIKTVVAAVQGFVVTGEPSGFAN